uniref:Chloride intracellular channel 3 n=1 Tax=Neogobius melanostomus TaxID=47308 RepID=A0A8C6WIT4_9GOBI
MAEEPKIELFLKASGDAESVGNCPFGQRLFMILWLKGANFTVTTVDMKRAPLVLKNLAPGSQPPFLLYNGELKTDTNKIEEFLEEALAPPKYPKLCCRHNSSKTAGEDIFRTFSAYIKIGKHGLYEQLEKKFLRSLTRLDQYLSSPLDTETNQRAFLDGDTLTLADCNLLPKLHIVRVVCKTYRGFDFSGLKGISRYMAEADKKRSLNLPAHKTPKYCMLTLLWRLTGTNNRTFFTLYMK